MPSAGFGALKIVLLPVHEHDDVGILLDGAQFTQVRELWPLVLAVLHGARELGKGEIGTFSSLASAFRPVVISDTSCTRFSLAACAEPVMQLQVVDDERGPGPAGA